MYDDPYVRGEILRVDQKGVLDNVKVVDEFDLLEQGSGRRSAGFAVHTLDQVECELVVLVLGQGARVHEEERFARRPNESNVVVGSEQLLELLGQGERRIEGERTIGLDRAGEQKGRRRLVAACQTRELIGRIGRLDASDFEERKQKKAMTNRRMCWCFETI